MSFLLKKAVIFLSGILILQLGCSSHAMEENKVSADDCAVIRKSIQKALSDLEKKRSELEGLEEEVFLQTKEQRQQNDPFFTNIPAVYGIVKKLEETRIKPVELIQINRWIFDFPEYYQQIQMQRLYSLEELRKYNKTILTENISKLTPQQADTFSMRFSSLTQMYDRADLKFRVLEVLKPHVEGWREKVRRARPRMPQESDI